MGRECIPYRVGVFGFEGLRCNVSGVNGFGGVCGGVCHVVTASSPAAVTRQEQHPAEGSKQGGSET